MVVSLIHSLELEPSTFGGIALLLKLKIQLVIGFTSTVTYFRYFQQFVTEYKLMALAGFELGLLSRKRSAQ